MNTELEDTLMGIATAQSMSYGGSVQPRKMADGGNVPSQNQMDMMMQAEQAVAEAPADPNVAIAQAIEELMMQSGMTDDPTEKAKLEHLAEAAMVGSQAPMAEQAILLAQQGRGDDSALAHLRPGEVVLPPEAFEDEAFEMAVQNRFAELDIDPMQAVVGVGIASLNPITGLEEFGFFKKIAKGVKKVVKKVVKPLAQVAQFVPGPWQPIAALANKAFTVYDVAKGGNPLALLTVAGPLATGGSLTDNISNISKAGSGSFMSGLGKSMTGSYGALKSGIGGLMADPLGTFTGSATGGGIPGLLRTASYSGQPIPAGTVVGAGSSVYNPGSLYGSPQGGFQKVGMQLAGMGGGGGGMSLSQLYPGGGMQGGQTPEDYAAGVYQSYIDQGMSQDDAGIMAEQAYQDAMNQSYAASQGSGGLSSLNRALNPFISGGAIDNAFDTPQWMKDLGNSFGLGSKNPTPDMIKGLTNPNVQGGFAGGLGGLLGGGGGMGGLGQLATAGIPAYLLGKMAYDEAKKDRGVALTPLTTMNAAGRYNIEAEIARRMGDKAPNPTEFGLLPSNTLPQLAGGAPQSMAYGGPVMAYADGGNVSMQEFQRMVGDIEGEGTEISDDIPAMLSDGEFVMNGQAVRGAGAFTMKKDGGIITLEANGKESRDKGTDLMYQMMELFKEFAGEPA